jgi:hypothetical protein
MSRAYSMHGDMRYAYRISVEKVNQEATLEIEI